MNAFLHQIPKLPQVAGKYWFYKFALMSPLLINHKHFLGKYFVFPKSTLGSATLPEKQAALFRFNISNSDLW